VDSPSHRLPLPLRRSRSPIGARSWSPTCQTSISDACEPPRRAPPRFFATHRGALRSLFFHPLAQVVEPHHSSELLPTPHRHTYTFFIGELSRRRCAGELPPRRRPTSSVRSRAHTLVRRLRHGPWTTPHRHLPVHRPAATCLRPCRAKAGALRAVWVRHGLSTRCAAGRAGWARPCPIAAGPTRSCALCTWVDRAGFGPWTVFKIDFFLFISI
jgi:hypothetical protein